MSDSRHFAIGMLLPQPGGTTGDVETITAVRHCQQHHIVGVDIAVPPGAVVTHRVDAGDNVPIICL